MTREPLFNNLPKLIDAVGRVYAEENQNDYARLLAEAKIDIEETSFDNWNGGTYGYTVELHVSAKAFARLNSSLSIDVVETDIKERLQRFGRLYQNEFVESVIIAPSLDETEVTQNIGRSQSPDFWTEGYFHLFISHVSSFKSETATLSKLLLNFGINGFVAHEHILPTKEWEDEIRLALSTCDALTCLLTEQFNRSDWTDQELGIALGRGVLVLPIRLGLDPYGFIGRHQGYQGFNKPMPQIAFDLTNILATNAKTKNRMAEAIVTNFEKSDSWAQAKERVGHLDMINSWNENLVSRVKAALENNIQIAEAFGVRSKIKRLFSRVNI